MKDRQSSPGSHTTTLIVGGGAVLLFILLLLIALSMIPHASPQWMPSKRVPASKGGTSGISVGPLIIEGCITKKGNKKIALLMFRNTSMWSIKDLRINKALLEHQSAQNLTMPLVIKSLPGKGVQKVVLEFSQTTSDHLELEVEYRGGGILGSGSGSILRGWELPPCPSHTTPP